MRIAGIMSGTSLDGIDVAIVDFNGKRVKTLAHATTAWPAAIRTRILGVADSGGSVAEISRLNFELAELYAKAVQSVCRKGKVPLESVQLVGCHGQTVYHEGRKPGGNTLQIGEPSVIAERLKIPVVSNFRTRDMAAGGQGAPLVPFVDYLLFRSVRVNRVALNIGGIANITVLPAGGAAEEVRAFDTGPGNMVIDQLAARHSEGRNHYDRGGSIAAGGHVLRDLLDELLKDKSFQTKPPKTAGREQYGQDFVGRLLGTGAGTVDLIATATAFTAATIALGVKRFAPDTSELIASGGGVHNEQLMGQLAAFLPGVKLVTSADFGIDPDAKEAIAFAILAWRSFRKLPGNLPSATGARHPVVLGSITF
jgi:anhydro-N-acetylmuramic acid kinase